MNLKKVKVEYDDGIMLLKIDNPPANTLGKQTLEDIEKAIDTACEDNKVKAIVITGEGKMFIAGADIKEINQASSGEEGEKMALHGQQIFSKIENMKKPVIAAINGACLGGGMELAMACHIRLAAKNAKFGQPEINLGLIPGFGGTQRLARLTNRATAMEWILTGDLYSADEAYRLGLVNRTYPLEELLIEAKSLAKKIVGKSSVVMEKAMEAINKGLEVSLDEGFKLEASLFGEVFLTEDKKEGVQAFIEKRAPKFRNK